ncbi:pyrroline-5-carboxylate reductase [Thermoplasmatales archaeon BRNA1]|nr:pyrroline-5-carboxylate reductase [Thermoplasmatales archaeon BRNA1]
MGILDKVKETAKPGVRIGFIGAGRMAGAMIDGLIAKKVYSRDEIVACAPTESSRQRMSQKSGIKVYEKASDIAPLADIIVLACKPKNIAPLFNEEGLVLGSNHLLISIAAGVKINTLQSYVPDARIVRVMPNHCCMVLEGAAGYVMGPGCSEEDRKTVDTIMAAIGLSVQVREQDLDAVTGIAGSSPAFIYMMARGLVEAGMKYGLTEEQSVKLAAQSLIGAGHMVLESGMGLDALIDGVCSPGGTTIEGCKVLEQEGFEGTVVRCVDATVARSVEMGKQ